MSDAKRHLAVIGCGYWGRNLVRNFAELGALAGVADAHRDTEIAMATQYGVPARNVDEILTDKSITAVAIATPAAQHAALAKRALEAGKHVFVEKPLALDLGEAHALETRAAKKKRTLMVGHLLQYHPAYLKLRELAAKGEFGAIRHIRSTRLSLGKVRTEENVLWSFAPHDISMVLGLMGAAPRSVAAQATFALGTDIADSADVALQFEGGATATVLVSWLEPVKEQKLTLIGEKAMAVFDDTLAWESKLTLYRHRIEHKKGAPAALTRAEGERIALVPAEPLREECAHFLAAVAGKSPVRTDAAEGIRVLSVLEAAEKAMSSGTTETVIPAKAGIQTREALLDSGEEGLDSRLRGNDKDYFVHPTAVIDDGVTIGAGSKVWHFSHLLSGVTIGRDCTIGQNVMIGPDVTVGDRCKVQNNVSLYKGVTLGDGVFCGPSCVFTNVSTPRAEVARTSEYLPTKVGKAATIGANATIVCGNALGEYCFVGAGAVVTKPVKPHALVVGNPAKQIGWVGHAGERLGADLTCPREGRRYKVSAKGTLEEIAKEKLDVRPAKPGKKSRVA
ncbi:MAG: Gfo/Idh/MocA family oxidoreductase [Alphaproteobacteria bacterium]